MGAAIAFAVQSPVTPNTLPFSIRFSSPGPSLTVAPTLPPTPFFLSSPSFQNNMTIFKALLTQSHTGEAATYLMFPLYYVSE